MKEEEDEDEEEEEEEGERRRDDREGSGMISKLLSARFAVQK